MSMYIYIYNIYTHGCLNIDVPTHEIMILIYSYILKYIYAIMIYIHVVNAINDVLFCRVCSWHFVGGEGWQFSVRSVHDWVTMPMTGFRTELDRTSDHGKTTGRWWFSHVFHRKMMV